MGGKKNQICWCCLCVQDKGGCGVGVLARVDEEGGGAGMAGGGFNYFQ